MPRYKISYEIEADSISEVSYDRGWKQVIRTSDMCPYVPADATIEQIIEPGRYATKSGAVRYLRTEDGQWWAKTSVADDDVTRCLLKKVDE